MRSPALFTLAQAVAAAVVAGRLARGRRRRPPLSAGGAPPPAGEVSVVIPARDEAARIGPCLEGLRGDPDVAEVLVVDDRSTDATAEVTRAAGARVVAGTPLPHGWVGKPWALQQGLEAARGDYVVTLDADTRPRPGLVRALVGELERDGADVVTAGVRFECDTAGERLLHPSLVATLVYRFGPLGVDHHAAPHRTLMNGQCVAVRRAALLDAGGFGLAAGHMTDDVALARALVGRGWRLVFADAADLISVRMHESPEEMWREWGRSIAMNDVTPRAWQAADLAVVWLTLGLPPLRAAARRATWLDRVLLAVRWLLLVPLARAYARRDLVFWLSPLADPLAAVRLTLSTLRPSRTWRGRRYR